MVGIRFTISVCIITVFSACDESPPYDTVQSPLIPGLDMVEVIENGYWYSLTGGSLTLGSGGLNTMVTGSNVAEVIDSLMSHIFSAYRQAIDFQGNRVALKQSFADGKSGHVDLSGACTGDSYNYESDFIAVFHDYAGWESELYIGGKLHYSGRSWGDVHAYDSFGTEFVVNGTLDFAGLYSGSITLVNVNCVPGTWAKRYSGKLLVESGGQLFIHDLNKVIEYE